MAPSALAHSQAETVARVCDHIVLSPDVETGTPFACLRTTDHCWLWPSWDSWAC